MSQLQPDADGGEDVPRIVSAMRSHASSRLEGSPRRARPSVPRSARRAAESRQGISVEKRSFLLDGKEGHLVEMLADDVDEDRRDVPSRESGVRASEDDSGNPLN
jgi:hypothetical protein